MSTLNATVEDVTAGPDSNGESMSTETEKIVLSVILSIFCVLGTVGNALAFLIYNRKREKGTSTIFILSLAVTDFLTCLINLPYTIISLLLDYRLEYDILCKVFLYMSTFNVRLSSVIMVVIGIDRYFCICHPFLHVVTVPRSKACVIVLTIISALLCIVPALTHKIHRSTHNIALENVNISSQLLTNNPTTTTSGPFLSSTTTLYVNGLLLEPDKEFLSDLVNAGTAVSYRTVNMGVLMSTMTPLLAPAPTNTTATPINNDDYILDGVCVQTDYILSSEFISIYQYVLAGTYLFDFIILAILYALIYRSILVRRAWKSKRKRMSCYAGTHCPEASTVAEETQLTNVNGGTPETVVLKKNSGRFSSVMRDRTLHANVKTAAMLFVVTLVFIISFLPSWLMGLRAVAFNKIVFYMFYINSVINPVIYAFMNRTFRDDLFQLVKNCFRH